MTIDQLVQQTRQLQRGRTTGATTKQDALKTKRQEGLGGTGKKLKKKACDAHVMVT